MTDALELSMLRNAPERAWEPDQSHDRFLIAPARDKALVSVYWRWLELSKQFSGKTTTPGQPINRSLLVLLLAQQKTTVF